MSNKKKIVVVLLLIIIMAGTIIIATKGFNFDLKYQETKKIGLYIGKEFKIEDIKAITDETLQTQDVIIQEVEVYNDTVQIIAKDITEEQKTNLVNKINEKYETELKAEDVEIKSIPHTRLRDIVNPYITPFIIITTIILIYMAIRYYKLGIIKTTIKTIAILILAELMLISIIAITRLPVGSVTMPIVITVYMLTLIGITTNFEKKLIEFKDNNLGE